MGKNLLLVGVLLLTGVATGRTAVRAAEEPAANDAVFKMEEVSVFDVKEVGPYGLAFVGGQMAVCTPTPNPEVNAYPKLKSKRPLYGFMMVVRSPTSPAGGVKFHFVLDESGEGAPPADKPNESPDTPKGPADTAASKTEAKSPPPSKPSSMDLRSRFGSLGSATETKYDLLYFDANRDLDLTNDPVVKVTKEPPKGLTVGRNTKVFETINLQFEVPPDPETRKIRVFPTLQAYGPNTAYLRLYPASARRGKIRVGNQEYTAILSYPDGFTGRLDLPQTRLELIPAGEEPARRQLSRDLKWLCAMREVDGVLYRFSATPSGDELRVGPYRGDYGVLEVSAGGKDLRDLGAVGLFVAKERAVTFGAPVLTFPLPEEKSPRHCRHMPRTVVK